MSGLGEKHAHQLDRVHEVSHCALEPSTWMAKCQLKTFLRGYKALLHQLWMPQKTLSLLHLQSTAHLRIRIRRMCQELVKFFIEPFTQSLMFQFRQPSTYFGLGNELGLEHRENRCRSRHHYPWFSRTRPFHWSPHLFNRNCKGRCMVFSCLCCSWRKGRLLRKSISIIIRAITLGANNALLSWCLSNLLACSLSSWWRNPLKIVLETSEQLQLDLVFWV